MKKHQIWTILSIITVLAMILTACGTATQAPTEAPAAAETTAPKRKRKRPLPLKNQPGLLSIRHARRRMKQR